MKKSKTGAKETKRVASPSKLIDARIEKLGDWRGEMLAQVRKLIREADPEVVEEVKWRKPSNGMRGVPVWEHHGIICTGETYKSCVKLTFAKGAALEDPAGLFNSSLEGNVRRAIDIREGDRIDEKAFKALIRAAVALNTSKQVKARPVGARKNREGSRGAVKSASGEIPTLASRGHPGLVPGSIPPLAPMAADGWIPGTSPGMTWVGECRICRRSVGRMARRAGRRKSEPPALGPAARPYSSQNTDDPAGAG